MQQDKIIVSVGYPEMAQKFKMIAEQLDIQITIVEGILEEATQEIIKLLQKDNTYEAIISRAGTAKLIKNRVTLPVIHHDSDHFDLLDSFIRAKELGEKICFITYPEKGYLFDFKKIENALQYPVTVLPYENGEEMIKQIKHAKKLGMDVVVGGGIRAKQIVKSLNMKSMFLTSSERNIKRVLTLAEKISKDRRDIKSTVETLRAVINTSDDGIIFIDKMLRIHSCNSVACKQLKVSKQEIEGKSIDSLLIDPIRKEILKKLLNDNKEISHSQFHYSSVPLIVDFERIGTVIVCKEIKALQKLEKQIRRDTNQKGLVATYTFDDFIHQSKSTHELVELTKSYAKNNSTVLITGESGTGKEVLAQSIHNESNQKDGPFVVLNCAALPESILENELFGHVEGAFTGALKSGRAGVFELAHGGTIFLDEIGEIPLLIQTRLLRVLQERTIMRIGSDYVTPVDIRVIAATNKNLWNLVNENKFRLDLYFRLNILHINTVPLKERKEDIPLLFKYIMTKKDSTFTFEQLSPTFQSFLLSYHWPGNIRQLENVIERFIHMPNSNDKEQKIIDNIQLETLDTKQQPEFVHAPAPHFASHEAETSPSDMLMVKEGSMIDIEAQVIQQLMKKYNNRSTVSETLQISRTTLWKKLSQNS